MRKLTGNDMANIMGTTIAGYKVCGARVKRGNFSDSDHYGIILAKNERGRYVTWQFHLEDEKVEAYWGHYFDESYDAALNDFNWRDTDLAPALSTEYWDCECDTDFIRPNNLSECPDCGALREEMPDSRQNEVDEYLKNKEGAL